MRSVLVTRPQPVADELADKLRREGFEVYLAPMTEYVEIPAPGLDAANCQAIVFTSAQAVNVYTRSHPERVPYVFAVGDVTALAAQKAGFSRVYSASGDGNDIVDLIRSKKNDLHLEKILHLCGEDTAVDIGQSLSGDGIAVERVPIYRAQFLDHLPEDVGRALAEGDISTVTLFSARTAANFAKLMEDQSLKGVSADLEAVCLSDRVAAEIRGLPWRIVRVAPNPRLESVLDILRAKEEGHSEQAALPADPVIEAFGGLRPLANRLDITASTVQGWKKRGIIPESRVDAVLAAAREAGIDLDSLWTKGADAMSSDDDKNSGNAGAGSGAGGGKREGSGGFEDRRRRTDRRQKRAVVDRRGMVRGDNYAGPDRRAGIDRRSYEQRQNDRIGKEKWRIFNRSIVMGAFFSICILYAGAFLMAPEFFEMKEDAKQMKAMQAQIDRLQHNQQMQQKPPPTSIGTRIFNNMGEVQDKAEAVTSTVKAVTEIATTAVQSTATGKALQQLGKFLSNLTAMNSTMGGRKEVSASMAKLKAIVAASGANPAELNAAISAARKADPTLDKILKDVQPEDLQAAAMLMALNEYRSDISAGRPFAEDLALLTKLAGNDPKLLASLQRLAPYAANGVLSRDRLQKEFKGLAGDIVMAKMKGQDPSVEGEALQRLSALVKVRKVDDIKGDTVDATVARAQVMLNQGDVKGAIAQLQMLDGAPAEAAAPFVQQAQGSVEADESMMAIMQVIVQQVQERTGVDLGNLLQGLMGKLGGGGGGVPYMSAGAGSGASITGGSGE